MNESKVVFIYVYFDFLRQLRLQLFVAISWRKNVIIWIHLLLRQLFSRLLVTQNRSLNKASISLSGYELT